MEGCSKYCSFCVVPYTRGEEVSRPFDDVLTEVADLTDRGVKEITLLGQNVNAYRGRMSRRRDAPISRCCSSTWPRCPGSSAFATPPRTRRNSRQRLIDVYARVPQLVSHVHLPVQAGSDRILVAMKRGYTVLEYKSIVRRLRAVRPRDLHRVRTSSSASRVKPKRTSQATLRLVEEVGFDASFSFVYSRRPGTPAASLPDDTPHEDQARAAAAAAGPAQPPGAGDQPGDGRHAAAHPGGRPFARRIPASCRGAPQNNRVVNFAGAPRLIGQFLDVTITAALPHSLRGEALAAETSRLKPVELSFTPVDNQRLANLCGVLDENLKQIESALDVSISRRGENFTIAGAARAGRACRARRCAASTSRPAPS